MSTPRAIMDETAARTNSAAANRWRARPFGGTLRDLDVDLAGTAAPHATTAVLAACLSGADGPLDEAELWSWTVVRRLQALLAVTVATRGEHWTFSPRCTAPECGRPMDVPLRLGHFISPDDPERVECTLDDGRTLRVRVPTGADQLAWLRAGAALDTDHAALVPRLLVDDEAPPDPLPDAWLEAIDAALADADPLTALELETACPECGAANRLPLDLERTCLALLAAEQARLLDDVHRLALAYHWSERDILAIPPARRRQYLERLAEGETWW